jgi:hypothetical protein
VSGFEVCRRVIAVHRFAVQKAIDENDALAKLKAHMLL